MQNCWLAERRYRVPLAPKGVLSRFCDCGCVVARRPSRSVVPCRPRPRGPRTPWVRPNSNRRCGVRARQSRRLDSASTAAAKAVSCTSPRGLEAPRACTEVSTTRSGPRRPTRALSLPPLHPDAPRSLCRPRSRHNHRAAARRSARAAVSRARLSPAAQAKTNSMPQGLTRTTLVTVPALVPRCSRRSRLSSVASPRSRPHGGATGRASDTPLRAVRLHILRLVRRGCLRVRFKKVLPRASAAQRHWRQTAGE